MPLARIVTKWTEESQPLQAELRARGFEVETASADQSFAEPADLEITLEEMTPAQALARADEIADALDIPVFISPGSISEGSRPIAVIPIVPEAEVSTASEIMAAKEEEPEFDPVTFSEEEHIQAGQPVADAQVPMEALPEVEAALPEVETAPPEVEAALPEVETAPPEVEAALPEVEAAPPIEDALPEPVYAEQISEPVLDPPKAEEPLVLAPEVQEMVPELEAVMPDVEAWAREEGPVSDWPIWQAGAIDPVDFIKATPLRETPKPEPVQQVWRIRRNPFANERVFWRTAAWAAMVALSALVLGATVHRFSPIPSRFAGSTNQPTELKPAQSNAPAGPVAKPAAILKRTAVHEPPVSRSQANIAQTSPKARASKRHKDSSDSLVAEDTVVRYGAKPPAPKVQAQMKKPDGIKRYTDLK